MAVASPTDNESLTLEDFFDHVRYSNPFDQDRVSDPAEADVDVESIHHAQFEELVEYARKAQRDRRGVGVVLWGEAGVGKSHLLARFSRWAEREDRALYVFLHNIHVNPERLPRYVLKSVVSRLTAGRRREFHNSRLYRLLLSIVKTAINRFSDNPSGEHRATEAQRCFERLLEEHLGERPVGGAIDDPLIYHVLFQFFYSLSIRSTA